MHATGWCLWCYKSGETKDILLQIFVPKQSLYKMVLCMVYVSELCPCAVQTQFSLLVKTFSRCLLLVWFGENK